MPKGRAANSFEREYQKLRSVNDNLVSSQTAQAARAFKRMFTLPAAAAEERTKQVQDFAAALRQAVQEGGENYQVNLSLQGRTADYAAPNALTQNRTAPPRAVYDPRIVGNDMGLWVMGRTWIKFVHEAEEDLQEFSCPAGNICALLNGLAALAKGDAGAARVSFEKAATQAPSDVLAQLGLGTAAVIADDDDAAISYYRRALKTDPNNKTAKRNLKILTDN